MIDPHTPSALPSRPPPPPFRLPRARWRPGWMAVSALLHTLVLLLLVQRGWQLLQDGGDAAGPRGGGGGQSGAGVRFVQLPSRSAPREIPVPAPPTVTLPTLPVPPPTPPPLDVPPTEPVVATPPPVAALDASTAGSEAGGEPGAGPGTGGGVGAGVGRGVGNDSGPGRGGDGEYISPPDPRTLILPAQCARGRTAVRFWIEADGHVSRVLMDPPPKDAGCRREMLDKMMGYQFLPARTRDGRAVASEFQVQFKQ